MKLKLLSMFVALGLLVSGTNVSAETAEKQKEAEMQIKKADAAIIGIGDILNIFKGPLCSFLGTKAPPDCLKFCSSSVGAPDEGDLNCCLAAMQSWKAPVPQVVISAIGSACGASIVGCGPTKCKIGAIADLCGNLCCNSYGSTQSDLAPCLASQTKTCTNYPVPQGCNLCTGPCCVNPFGQNCSTQACNPDTKVCCAKGSVYDPGTKACKPSTAAEVHHNPFM
jgi:hypothetical protein